MSYVVRNGKRIETETVALEPRVGALARAATKNQFICVPLSWADQLGAARNTATIKVALQLLWLHFRDRGRPVQLGNAALALKGVSRKQKHRALVELVQLGLVRVERRARKSPIVTVILEQE